jgi:putative oxidoreductase
MDVVILIGRILFSAIFLSSAFGHFAHAAAMAGYTKSRGVPAARPAVLAGGVLLGLGGLSILFGVWPDLGALLLVIFLLPTAVLMHPFWKETDPQSRQTEQISFLKDVSLAGAALALLGLFAVLGDQLRFVIAAPLFG